MATHNSVRLCGYLLENPVIANDGVQGAEKVFIKIRTMRRDAEDVDPQEFEDVYVFYDGTELMPKIRDLKQFDLIDIKGVFNIVAANKPSRCPECGTVNFRMQGSWSFVYPMWIRKVDNVTNSYAYDAELPDAILFKHFREVSNYVTIIGTLVIDPEMIGTEQEPICRYRIGVDRKYYIKTQPDVKADYPWVYTRGQQAKDDYRHLSFKSLILVDGYIHTRNASVPTTCSHCESRYSYPDVVVDFIPYSVEYLNNYKTDEDIAIEAELAARKALLDEGNS